MKTFFLFLFFGERLLTPHNAFQIWAEICNSRWNQTLMPWVLPPLPKNIFRRTVFRVASVGLAPLS